MEHGQAHVWRMTIDRKHLCGVNKSGERINHLGACKGIEWRRRGAKQRIESLGCVVEGGIGDVDPKCVRQLEFVVFVGMRCGGWNEHWVECGEEVELPPVILL